MACTQKENFLDLMQVPSYFRGIPQREWDVPLPHGLVLCKLDPDQQLLVVVDARYASSIAFGSALRR